VTATRNLWQIRLDRAKARAEKRKSNRRFIAKVAGKPVRSIIKTGKLKENIVRLLGLLDRKINGPLCRLGSWCPAYAKFGIHNGTLAYHIVPQQRGDAARFLPENVIWACRAANCGEHYNRSLYEDKHLSAFGQERIDRIKAVARTVAHYSRADLFAMREQLKWKLAQP